MNSAFEGSHSSPDDHPALIIAKRRLFGALYGTKDADWAELVRGGAVFKSMLAEWPDMDDGDTIVRGSE